MHRSALTAKIRVCLFCLNVVGFVVAVIHLLTPLFDVHHHTGPSPTRGWGFSQIWPRSTRRLATFSCKATVRMCSNCRRLHMVIHLTGYSLQAQEETNRFINKNLRTEAVLVNKNARNTTVSQISPSLELNKIWRGFSFWCFFHWILLLLTQFSLFLFLTPATSDLEENIYIETIPANAFRGLCTQTIDEM